MFSVSLCGIAGACKSTGTRKSKLNSIQIDHEFERGENHIARDRSELGWNGNCFRHH